MAFESTPGVTTRSIQHPKRDGVEAREELIFVFDLSKMTLATAFADPLLSDETMSEWTLEQLFRVMLEPRENPPPLTPKLVHEETIEALRPWFLRRLLDAIEANPLNDKIIPFAALHDPKSGDVTSFRSTYTTLEEPDRPKNTVLHVSADATRYVLGGFKPAVRDDLFKPRRPSGGFIAYVMEFRRVRVKPQQRLVAKNDADVRKALAAMAYVQQINLALSFAEDFSLSDRSQVWHDFFEKVEPSGIRYFDMRDDELQQLFWHEADFSDGKVAPSQVAKLRDFRRTQVDPLIHQLGRAAAWASAAETAGVRACASARERDASAKILLKLLRMDDVLLNGLENWDELAFFEQKVLLALFDDLLGLFSRCPGAMESLLQSEFLAVARGAVASAGSILDLPRESSRQKLMADAIAAFDTTTLLGREKKTPLTKVIISAFERYEKTRRLAPPIVSLWAHSTPAILARFDKLTPERANVDGTAYLFRSVFGMGLMSPAEMNALYSDLDSILESAVRHGVKHTQTKRRLRRLFEEDLSHGKYPIRSDWWSEGRVFNSIKLAVGILGIRQGFVAAADEKVLPHERFVDLSAAVLRATGAASDLRPLLRSIFGAGRTAVDRGASFLDKLPPTAKLARITELVSLVSSYQAVGGTDGSSLERDSANADLAVAWLSLIVVIYEGALGTTFPVAGLALILLRWLLFDRDLWDLIGGITSASPMVKIVRGVLAKIESGDGEVGKLLRKAPSWDDIKNAIEGVRDQASESVPSYQLPTFPLFFHLETDHEDPVRRYAVKSYGVAAEIAEVLVED